MKELFLIKYHQLAVCFLRCTHHRCLKTDQHMCFNLWHWIVEYHLLSYLSILDTDAEILDIEYQLNIDTIDIRSYFWNFGYFQHLLVGPFLFVCLFSIPHLSLDWGVAIVMQNIHGPGKAHFLTIDMQCLGNSFPTNIAPQSLPFFKYWGYLGGVLNGLLHVSKAVPIPSHLDCNSAHQVLLKPLQKALSGVNSIMHSCCKN